MSNKHTPHPFSTILKAIADGKEVQWRPDEDGNWQYQDADEALSEIATQCYTTSCYRVKPDTIMFGKYEIVRPMLTKPALGTAYYYFCPSSGRADKEAEWDDYEIDDSRLKSGMCWLNAEDARAAAKAITATLKDE